MFRRGVFYRKVEAGERRSSPSGRSRQLSLEGGGGAGFASAGPRGRPRRDPH